MKIDKHIPIPISLTQEFKRMNIGESIFIEGVTHHDKPINGSRATAARVGIKIRCRAEGSGVRIWRTA